MRRARSAVGRALLGLALSVGAVAGGVQLAAPAEAASLQEVTNFGTNPSALKMFQYVPARLQARPPILVVLHFCQGSASAMYTGYAKEYVTAADTYGFVMVFPETTRSGHCWDVHSAQALKRDGGSDPVGIMSMVNYAKQRYNGDPGRIYLLGASSGAMMTNVLAGIYPDVFKAAVVSSGVPFGCFAGTGEWNSQCANGQITKTAQQWGDLVRNAYPGYTGSYPRMQLLHGEVDTTLSYHNYGEMIKQWTNLHKVGQTPVLTDRPATNWTRTRYGSTGTQPPVEGISFAGYGHSLPGGIAAYGIRFLGLDGTSASTPTPTTPRPTTPSPTTPGPTTPRPTTPSPTTPGPTTPSPTTPAPTGACSVALSTSSWTGGFVTTVTVTATRPVSGWRVTLSLPAGATVTNAWSATLNGASGTVTASNVAYNGTLGTGGSTQFGFQANGSPTGITSTCSAA